MTDLSTDAYRSPLLSRPGAVAGSGPDAGVAFHLGDPVHEQRALERGQAVVDLSHLGVVTVSGPDRISWLTTLSSQQLTGMTPGTSTELLLLAVHGQIEHAVAVQDDGTRTWLITEREDVEPLRAFLDRMRFMLRVEVTVEDQVAVLGTAAGGWQYLPAEPSVLTWNDPWPRTGPGGTTYGPPDAEHPGIDIHRALTLVRRERLTDAVEGFLATAGPRARVAGTWAWEALRVEAWRPRFGCEVDERALPHELDWLRTGVHLEKGCYRGQETVARVINLGRPPRRLVMLHLDGSEHLMPEAGAEVSDGRRVVGRVTSAVRHAELGPVALALVKRSVPAGTTLDVDGVAAAQEIIVPPDGVSAASPAERPGAELRRRAPRG
ncbi:glycine cleavage T C-terminal barrel domain-containing protein [Georgenia sp. 10Sc9-8]|uniref:Glycine cleavage T C-terminal barrel domain-containing protein n=1 Tax=Georgenia halotolerans TaxID=3028317 RepID=A0ABT5TYR4_9MICO|nr:glycine cleavage T C-terminal barrel domain-containing protein [Georgenia halotolerans]